MSGLSEQLEQFHRDGYLVVEDALAPDHLRALRAGVERAFESADPEADVYGAGLAKIWRPKMFEHGEPFEQLVDNARMINLVEAILGDECHLIANSALMTGPGEGISGWHADETVRLPLPEGVELDPRIQMPCYVLNLNYYLCDVDQELGPTEFVPRTHRSGRQPRPEDRDSNGNPTYKGISAVSAVAPAGTAVMWHDQTWHRGATNLSKDGIRWVQQAPYGRRWVAQRFYPFINYALPAGVVERANPRRRRLLGMHGLGAYG